MKRVYKLRIFGNPEVAHHASNLNCHEGWCGAPGWPAPCQCGGVIHADLVDDDFTPGWLSWLCDQCSTQARAPRNWQWKNLYPQVPCKPLKS
jgi:hypothetical protein